MGYRGSQTGELVFDNCRVPAANLVGGENQGVAVMMGGLDLERVFFAPACVGMAERCLELALDYATQRRQFGKRIVDFQAIGFKLADMWVGVETAKVFSYSVLAQAAAMEVGGGGRGELHASTAAALLYAAETMRKIADEALQIHGGYGYLWEMEINRLYRAAKLLEIGAGTNEIRRVIISEEMVKAHDRRHAAM